MNPYDQLIEKILNFGTWTSVRDGQTKCKTLVAERLIINEPVRFRRKIQVESAIAELLWFLSGSTYVPDLEKLGCKYWNQWVAWEKNKDWYEKTKIPLGYIGPTYGFQLRYFGAHYFDIIQKKQYSSVHSMNNDMLNTYQGVDQLSELLKELKKHPDSRRLVVSLWNPMDLHLMRLPPCAYSFHVQIINNLMILIVNMRSCDVMVGLPYNIIFYWTLLEMLAYYKNKYLRKELVICIENAHIYKDQFVSVCDYLRLPDCDEVRIEMNKKKDVLEYEMSDFKVTVPENWPNLTIPVTL